MFQITQARADLTWNWWQVLCLFAINLINYACVVVIGVSIVVEPLLINYLSQMVLLLVMVLLFVCSVFVFVYKVLSDFEESLS